MIPESAIWQIYSAGLGKGYQDKGFAKFAHGCSIGVENGLALTEALDARFP